MEFINLKDQYKALRLAIDSRVQAVLDHGQYIMGPEVKELESRLTMYTGSRNCVTVSSGTEALVLALMALGIKCGDEVITSAFSFAATAEAIVLVGATPVFTDIEPDTCNIDVSQIERHITARTRAIIPVSLYGQPADMDEINAIAGRYGIAVIEDGAQSFGADYRGKKSCNLSTIGCTSFFPSKPLGGYGDGGAIFTNDDGLAQTMRELRIHGQARRYVHTRIGVSGRMDTIQCAIVLAKLERFEWEVRKRAEIGALYNSMLDGHVDTMRQRPDRSSVFAQYTIALSCRDVVQKELSAYQIPTAIHYPLPIPLQPAYEQFSGGDTYPVAVAMAKRVLSLPMGPYMSAEQISWVTGVLLEITSRQLSTMPARVLVPAVTGLN